MEKAVSWAPGFFHAIAIDYDGTLAEAGRPHPQALDALGRARASGMRVVVVTGRILADLVAAFPSVDDHADLVVAEDGAVLARGGTQRAVAEPLPGELAEAMTARGIAFHRGQVLLACDGTGEPVVRQEIRRLGLDCQLVRNRSALMVLPAGVSKASGLAMAMAGLGIPGRRVVAIGDAENDLPLLAAADLGVAVGNAVAALKAAADIVLTEPDGLGVASFLRGMTPGPLI